VDGPSLPSRPAPHDEKRGFDVARKGADELLQPSAGARRTSRMRRAARERPGWTGAGASVFFTVPAQRFAVKELASVKTKTCIHGPALAPNRRPANSRLRGGAMKILSRVLSAVASLGLALAAAQTSHAAVLLSDNFDNDSVGSVLNFGVESGAFINWTVDSGTVDYIRSGFGGVICVGSTGGCVDSDGSTNDAGRLVSRATFDIPAGTPFTISLDVSGNQRRAETDQLDVGLVDATTLTPISALTASCLRLGIDGNANYSDCSLAGAAPGGSFKVFILGFGIDNIGAVFDNFVLDAQIDVDTQIPAPGSLALLGIGLAGLALARRREMRWRRLFA
jgi:hypothetical protein